jgi:hypothetical protein
MSLIRRVGYLIGQAGSDGLSMHANGWRSFAGRAMLSAMVLALALITAPAHAGGFCLLALIPWTVDLRVAPLAALSSAISFKAEASSAQAPMLSRSAYTIH